MLFFHGITLEISKIAKYKIEVNEESNMMMLQYQNMNYIIPILTKREQSKRYNDLDVSDRIS